MWKYLSSIYSVSALLQNQKTVCFFFLHRNHRNDQMDKKKYQADHLQLKQLETFFFLIKIFLQRFQEGQKLDKCVWKSCRLKLRFEIIIFFICSCFIIYQYFCLVSSLTLIWRLHNLIHIFHIFTIIIFFENKMNSLIEDQIFDITKNMKF